MPNYAYEAVLPGGKKVAGMYRALNKQAAIFELREKNLIVRSIEEKEDGWLGKELSLGKPVKQQEFVIFCRQFATLIRSGIQIDKALDIMEDQSSNKKLKRALADARDKVLSGQQLSQAMKDHSLIFPEMFVNMVMSGETGGSLDDVLDRMAEHYEKEHKTIQKVKSAMTYPIIVLIFAIGVVTFLLLKIVPTFVGMFQQQGQQLPWITRLVMGASDFVVAYWWLCAIIAIAVIVAIRFATTGEKGKLAMDKLKFRMPVFGAVFRKAAIARLARTMSSLYSSGVPLLDAIDITIKVCGNRVMGEVLAIARGSMSEGKQLSEPFKQSPLFPKMATSMLTVGEETGQVDKMFGKIADFYENDVEETVNRLKSTIEPLMLLIVSAIVGIIITAIMSPMFKMYENMLG